MSSEIDISKLDTTPMTKILWSQAMEIGSNLDKLRETHKMWLEFDAQCDKHMAQKPHPWKTIVEHIRRFKEWKNLKVSRPMRERLFHADNIRRIRSDLEEVPEMPESNEEGVLSALIAAEKKAIECLKNLYEGDLRKEMIEGVHS